MEKRLLSVIFKYSKYLILNSTKKQFIVKTGFRKNALLNPADSYYGETPTTTKTCQEQALFASQILDRFFLRFGKIDLSTSLSTL